MHNKLILVQIKAFDPENENKDNADNYYDGITLLMQI